jgi:hypothetical protein
MREEWIMKISKVLRLFVIVFVAGFIALPITQTKGHSNLIQGENNKPPEVIQGGEWSDHFWTGQLQEASNIDIQVSHLFLKNMEQLHWTQTWTAHFAGGEFWQTETISDSVRLAWNDLGQSFFTTGTYTSVIFDAGKTVDWSTSAWRYSGIPDGLIVEFRTGNTPVPDDTWINWQLPRKVFMEYYCAYTFNSDETECFTNMSGIDSSQYIQYRASFSSNDSTRTITLYEIDFLYGTHYLTGTALSILIPPADLREWESVIITSTIPANTTLVIDILDPSGTILIPNVTNGTSLEGINPHDYPAIQLRASFTSTDESISPDVDLWGLKWLVWNKLYLPVMLR